MTAIILAGGKATRMAGRDKAFLRFGREFLIRRQIRLFKKIFKNIIIVTNSPEKYKNIKNAKIITDAIPHQGPLGGILAGLEASTDEYNFTIAVDMPFASLALIKYMYKKRGGFSIVVPKANNRFEPLFSIYSKNCIRPISEMLDKKIFKIRRLFPKVKIKEVTEREILRFGLPAGIFANINTPQDLRKILLDKSLPL